MNVLIVSTSDVSGGASVAARRLMHALNSVGHETSMLVCERKTQDEHVVRIGSKWRSLLKKCVERAVIWISNRFSRKGLFAVDLACTGYDITTTPQFRKADIINLHWVNQGMMSVRDIKRVLTSGKPVVITMHDMWYSTGICHYSHGCTRYASLCHHCPQLQHGRENDLSRYTFAKKQKMPLDGIAIVAVSSWLQQIAQESALTKHALIRVIPNVLDLGTYHPIGAKAELRKKWHIPQDKIVLIMGAARLDAPIKGLHLLETALRQLKHPDDYCIILLGSIKTNANAILAQLCIEHYWMGHVADTQIMVQLYSAADITVVPSLYETFGQTIIEGMACGCTAVTFDGSGQSDIISHCKDGYLAQPYNTADFAQGIEWAASQNRDELSEICINKVHSLYSSTIIAEQYTALFKSVSECG